MRLKSILVTALIALSTIALPTALIVAPTVLTGCANLGGGDLLGTLAGLGQSADQAYQSYQVGVDAGHFPPSQEISDKYAQYKFLYDLFSNVLKPKAAPPAELVAARTELVTAISAHKAAAKAKKATAPTP